LINLRVVEVSAAFNRADLFLRNIFVGEGNSNRGILRAESRMEPARHQ
jgi:hypothetical protein